MCSISTSHMPMFLVNDQIIGQLKWYHMTYVDSMLNNNIIIKIPYFCHHETIRVVSYIPLVWFGTDLLNLVWVN